MRKIALVTGATSGIGEATAMLLAENNYNIIITGRRADRLALLKTHIQKNSSAEVLTLHFDVRSNDEVVKAVDSIPGAWQNIDVLVNNAGLAVGLEHIQDGVLDDWERMIDTNIKGMLYVTKKIAPLMIRNNAGHIVNIGSIAGKEVYENGNVYCATKFAVDALTRGMRIDLLKHNIRVCSICPGMVETEFSVVRFKGNAERAKKVYDNFPPLTAKDIADTILFIVTRPSHVNISDVLITPTGQASAFYSLKG